MFVFRTFAVSATNGDGEKTDIPERQLIKVTTAYTRSEDVRLKII